MKISLLHIVGWAILFCLICDSDGKKSKKGAKRPVIIIPGQKQNSKQKDGFKTLDNRYYFSTNAGTWDAARADCEHSVFPGTGKLVNIEEEDEWNKLKKLAREFGGASTYWTGGQYTIEKKDFVWENGKDVDVSDWDVKPWLSGQPPSSPGTKSKIGFVYVELGTIGWTVEQSSYNARYICENEG